MPEPISKYSTDRPIYYITKKLAPSICFIHPNVISMVGFLFVIPILYNLYKNRSVCELIILGFIRQFFDCLDGTVARSCNTCSLFGAKLDIGLDFVTFILISIYIILHIIYHPPELYTSIILSGMVIGGLYYLGKYLYDKQQADKNNTDIDKIEFDPVSRFCHDNSIIITILLLVFIKKIHK